MSVAHHASRRGAPSQFVWISDSLLAAAVQRFSHCATRVRHQSNTPGPLEARRRATKRRNGNLAVTATGASLADADLIFGRRPRDGLRLGDREPGAQPRMPRKTNWSTVLQQFEPSWPARPPPPPTHPNAFGEPPIDNLLTREDGPSNQDAVAEFRSRLQAAREMEDVIALIGNSTIQRLARSEIAFEFLLDSKWGVESVAAFLLDPSLNPSGTQNLQTMIKRMLQDSNLRRQLFSTALKALSLGMLSCEDVRLLVEGLPEINDYPEASRKLQGSLRLHDYYKRIYEAISQSTVFGLKDLDSELIRTWLSKIEAAPFCMNAAKLTWSLRQYAQRSDIELATKLVRCLIISVHESPKRKTTGAVIFLQELPVDVLAHVLPKVSANLVSAATTDYTQHKVLEVWRGILSHVDERSVSQVLKQTSVWRCVLLEDHQDLTPQQHILVVSWTIANLCHRAISTAVDLGQLGFQSELAKTFPITKGRDQLAEILRVLQTLPLPASGTLISKLHLFTPDVVATRAINTKLHSILAKIPSKGFINFEDDTLYGDLQRYFPSTLIDVAESVNADLTAFRRISRKLIHGDKLTFRIITRILKNNEKLKLALAKTWHRRDGGTESRDGQRQVQGQLDAAEILQLFDHLAVSFALTDVVSGRAALRNVYWVLCYLHRYGAPISPTVTRALWHAGVTRNGPRGASVTVVRWILKHVRDVEGERTAKMLLMNAGFRKAREQEILAYHREEDLEEEHVLMEMSGQRRNVSSLMEGDDEKRKSTKRRT